MAKLEDKEPCCCGSEEQGEDKAEQSCCCGDIKKKNKKEKKSKKGKKKKEGKKSKETEQSCCCGDSGCCSDSAYSCEDDPYKGYKKNVIVDFLFLDLTVCDRCQGTDERVARAVEKCRPVLEACGYNLVLNQIDVENAALAERYRFYSSPTVRVNGVDVCPSIEENDCDCCSDISDYDVKCRVFPFNGTYYEVPPTDMLVANIIDTVIKQKKADPEEGPYVLPENLRGFFEGRERKEREVREGAASTSAGCCCC
ncbi:DUF2703 domain-containing protein [Adlercreutzia sp. ZJ242]|uniref:DUF2703 domain-containing protein n=1 Tax=Adlercreutzia sp. ZJ242 TaxID=2709409 RepID=UPI0013ED3F44|nr:DUF2703 domain-containing protein [Adlercreutzia sp. ZJ242]